LKKKIISQTALTNRASLGYHYAPAL